VINVKNVVNVGGAKVVISFLMGIANPTHLKPTDFGKN